MALKQLTSVVGICVLGSLSAVALADKPNLNVVGDETSVDVVNNGSIVIGDQVLPAACDQFVYDSGDSPVWNTGRTVGMPSGDRWEVYQPVVFNDDVTVCGIDVDGWYVTGVPDTFEVGIYPDDGSGNPDLGNRLTFGDIKLGVSGMVNWKSVDVDPVCLTAGETYYIGTMSAGNHWSAIYRDCPNGLPSFSVKNGDFSSKFGSTTTAMRLRGTSGCGSCLDLTVNTLVSGSVGTWDVSGATPGAEVAVVYGHNPGSTIINGYAGYCADFGINGVGPRQVICRKIADGAGNIACRKTLPNGISGVRVLSQAAERDTCPDTCMSNIDDQIVG